MAPLAANATAGFIGMFLFMALFAAVIYVLLRPGAKQQADLHAQIPFKEEESHG